MLRVAVIGGGYHSREHHLPALARYVSQHPNEVELAAFCDLQRDVAGGLCREYGFGKSYADIDRMLASESLDACLTITPVSANASIAKRIIDAGIPLLMEKPPGSTQQEARELCEFVADKNARVMVSMNRRFDPALAKARSWIGDRPLEHVRASMYRHRRTERNFLVETALHSLDTVRWLAGDILDYSVHAKLVDEAWWYRVHIEFDRGATGLLEVLPTCGSRAEFYEMFGPGCRVRASAGDNDSGEVAAWEDGKIVLHEGPASDIPPFVKGGTFAETIEFLTALREEREFHPSPQEVWQSVDICHRIQEEAVAQSGGHIDEP